MSRRTEWPINVTLSLLKVSKAILWLDKHSEPIYGSAIYARTNVSAGTLYPMLGTMLTYEWLHRMPIANPFPLDDIAMGPKAGKGPPRTFYGLTEKGRMSMLKIKRTTKVCECGAHVRTVCHGKPGAPWWAQEETTT